MISGKILRDAIISGANNINNQRSRVDELNVFPVPDGDTGTNMGMTVGASVRELEALDDSCTVGEASKTAASAMLRGARGNSGVITSLLFRGFSKALEGKKEATAADIVEALKKGVEGAYKAVMKPTEGTILTVARVASEEAAACGAEEIPALWDVVMTAGQKALEDTPNLLPVLKKAGVVDAGGQGIMIIFEGMGKVFHGEPMVAGGWMGLAVKSDGGAIASGAIAESLILAKAAEAGINWEPGWIIMVTTTVKIFIDVFIGVWALVLAWVWCTKFDKSGDRTMHWGDVWARFPRFVLGYIITFAILLIICLQSPELQKTGASVSGTLNAFRVIFFLLTFFTIGMVSNFRKLMEEGIGRLAIVYVVCLFGFIIWLGLFISWLFFHGMTPPLAS